MINGIQQVGIGTPDVHASFKWYRKHFGFDVPVFDEAAEAPLMTQYTGNKVQSRHAILAMNLNGGGGMEIWQYTSRKPTEQPEFSLKRPGLLVVRIKCENAEHGRSQLKPMSSRNESSARTVLRRFFQRLRNKLFLIGLARCLTW